MPRPTSPEGEAPPIPEEEATPQFACPDCATEYADAEDADRCCQFQCSSCEEWHTYEEDARTCCQHPCPECGTHYTHEEDAATCCPTFHCPGCGESYRYEEDAENCCYDEDYPRAVTPPRVEDARTEYNFFLDNAPRVNRPNRLTSIEQEIVEGGAYALGTFNHFGWTQQEGLYDDGDESDRLNHTVVKGDGSLPSGGCEIVYGKRELWKPTKAAHLGLQLATLREIRSRGLVRTGYAAGTHIHISARDARDECLSARDVASLYGVVNHIEDLLYRFAAAGWRAHRRDDGRTYSEPFRKLDRKANAWRIRQTHPGRYYAVSFDRLFAAVTQCHCGACRMAAWEDCSCESMNEATVEWRIFNSSTKPETLHAWVIAAHALIERARQEDYSELKPHLYVGSGTPLEEADKQLKFLLECPMSERERAVVQGALERSPGVYEDSERLVDDNDGGGRVGLITTAAQAAETMRAAGAALQTMTIGLRTVDGTHWELSPDAGDSPNNVDQSF